MIDESVMKRVIKCAYNFTQKYMRFAFHWKIVHVLMKNHKCGKHSLQVFKHRLGCFDLVEVFILTFLYISLTISADFP